MIRARARVRTLSLFFHFFRVAILGRFWEPAGTPKSTKNRFFAKKGAPGSSFLTIFVARAFFLDFFVDFPSILAWKSMFFRVWFLFSSRVFLHLATLTIVWFLQYESYFFIFRVFSFLRQKSSKIDAKTRSQNMIKKWWSGHPFWVPKSMKIDAGTPEKRPNCENMSFLEGTVFSSFF